MIKKTPNLTLKRVWIWDIWILIVSVNCLLIWWCLFCYKAFSEDSPSMNQTHKCETFGLEAFVCENHSYQTIESCFCPFIPWASEGKRSREYRAALFLPAGLQGLWSPSAAKHSAPGHVASTFFTWLEMFHEGDNRMMCKKLNAWPHTCAAVIYTPEKC